MREIAIRISGPAASRAWVFCLSLIALFGFNERVHAGMADAPSCFSHEQLHGRTFCVDHEDYYVFVREKEVSAEDAKFPSDATECERYKISDDIVRALSIQIRGLQEMRRYFLSTRNQREDTLEILKEDVMKLEKIENKIASLSEKAVEFQAIADQFQPSCE